MLRFASPPTRDMTLSDLGVALLNFVVAAQRKENLIVRIEDTDKEKNIEGKDQEILDILALFGIEYSQVNYQSQNYRFHSAMALDLLHKKKAFNCFCPLRESDERYDGTCQELPAELVIDNPNPFTVRIKTSHPEMLDSFIILHQDKTPTYDFASAVDDMLSDISLVVSQDSYKTNALKQECIREALGYDKKIAYLYMPSFLNETPSIKSLLEEGFLPSAISNYLISFASKTPKEIFTIQEAIEWFGEEMLRDTPERFDKEKLLSINREHLKMMDPKELSRYVGFADEEIGKLARLYLEEAATTKELREKMKPIFEEKEIPKELEESAQRVRSVIQKAPYFETYDDFKSYVAKETPLQEEQLVKVLRLLLSGAEHGPDLSQIYAHGKNYLGEIVK